MFLLWHCSLFFWSSRALLLFHTIADADIQLWFTVSSFSSCFWQGTGWHYQWRCIGCWLHYPHPSSCLVLWLSNQFFWSSRTLFLYCTTADTDTWLRLTVSSCSSCFWQCISLHNQWRCRRCWLHYFSSSLASLCRSQGMHRFQPLLGKEASSSIGNTLWRIWTMFTRSAITPPEVNRFGWNFGNSEYIVYCFELALTDFGRDPRTSESGTACRNFVFFVR